MLTTVIILTLIAVALVSVFFTSANS